jgi:hypothetical protein
LKLILLFYGNYLLFKKTGLSMRFWIPKMVVFVLIALINIACNSSGQNIEKEYDGISRRLDSVNAYLSKLQESKIRSQTLKDSINYYRASYDSIRTSISKKIKLADSTYLVDIQTAKEDFYSKYGDDSNSQSFLDKAIDQAKAKNEALIASYKKTIKEAEDVVKSNPKYQKFKEDLASLPKYSESKEEKALEKQKELSSRMEELKLKLSKK